MVRLLNVMMAVGFGLGLSSIAWADDFSAAVEKVLMQQKEITDLNPDLQREMVTCVNGVLADVPDPTKAELAQAASLQEMEDRFGEMVMADQAALKQQITETCGGITMQDETKKETHQINLPKKIKGAAPVG